MTFLLSINTNFDISHNESNNIVLKFKSGETYLEMLYIIKLEKILCMTLLRLFIDI